MNKEKKTICVMTATRAEYGLLKPVLKKISNEPQIKLKIVVTGMHLEREFGYTYKEIEEDGFIIDAKIPILDEDDSPKAISRAMGKALTQFGIYFAENVVDMLLVLGDRYETLAVCCAAMNQRIPIAHIGGGETTEGAVDEAIRHAISKLSILHFTATESYRKRVIQLGEHPQNVYYVGGLGVENIESVPLLNKEELSQSIGQKLDKPFFLVTFHPVTLECSCSEVQMKELLKICNEYQEYLFLFTKANADADGRIINELIDCYAENHDNAIAFESLGLKRYLSAMKHCEAVMGNSSSGILEAPSFGIPTINIGDRQKGRVQAESVINCDPNYASIKLALEKATSTKFRNEARRAVNPYKGQETSNKIVETIKEYLVTNKIELKKIFYDIGGSVE